MFKKVFISLALSGMFLSASASEILNGLDKEDKLFIVNVIKENPPKDGELLNRYMRGKGFEKFFIKSGLTVTEISTQAKRASAIFTKMSTNSPYVSMNDVKNALAEDKAVKSTIPNPWCIKV